VKPAGIILAGGLSRRIGGGDKTLRHLAGRPILDHVIARFGPQVGALALNANGDPQRFDAWPLPVIADSVAGYPGPLAGILAGMDWAARLPAPPAFIVTVPADAPFLPFDLVERLSAARDAAHADIAVAFSGGRRQPVIGLWRLAMAGELRRAMTSGLRKVEAFIDRFCVEPVDYPTEPLDPFLNINSQADLALAEAIASRMNS
jgi:molybdopterin-guanine dinucleotide biosynthesis protein A